MNDKQQLEATRDALSESQKWAAELQTQLRDAMTERARLVAFLASRYEAVRVPDWDDDEGGYVLVSTPVGQISFWVSADDIDEMMPHLPLVDASVQESHPEAEDARRLAELTHAKAAL